MMVINRMVIKFWFVDLKILSILVKNLILQTGDFSLSPEVLQTWATAMDIQVQTNNDDTMHSDDK